MATLLYIITEGIKGGPFELTDGTHILGSAEGATILVPDSTISAQHGQFDVVNGQIVYQDLGSQNGSFVSDQPRAQAQPLLPGGREGGLVGPGLHCCIVFVLLSLIHI